MIDGFLLDDEGSGRAEVFRYDFDAPSTVGILGGSLGNDIETIIGPGDSGGGAFRQTAGGWELIGINTYAGHFHAADAAAQESLVSDDGVHRMGNQLTAALQEA